MLVNDYNDGPVATAPPPREYRVVEGSHRAEILDSGRVVIRAVECFCGFDPAIDDPKDADLARYTPEVVRGIADRTALFIARGQRPVVVVRHKEKDAPELVDWTARGSVLSVAYEERGGVGYILGDLEIPRAVWSELIESGAYPRRSAEIWPDGLMSEVALLGRETPKRPLPDMRFARQGEASRYTRSLTPVCFGAGAGGNATYIPAPAGQTKEPSMADDKDKDELSRMKAELARYKKKFGAVDDDEKDENDRDEDKDENRRGARRARRGAGVAGKSLLVDDAETPAQASRLARLMGEFARLDSENDDTDGGVETGVRGGDPSIHARLDALEAALVDERATAAMLRLERDGYVTKGNREAVAAQFARVEKLADVADVDTMVRALTTPVPQSAGRLSAGSHDFARDSAHKDPEAEQARVARAVRDAKGDPEKFRRIIEGKD